MYAGIQFRLFAFSALYNGQINLQDLVDVSNAVPHWFLYNLSVIHISLRSIQILRMHEMHK